MRGMASEATCITRELSLIHTMHVLIGLMSTSFMIPFSHGHRTDERAQNIICPDREDMIEESKKAMHAEQ